MRVRILKSWWLALVAIVLVAAALYLLSYRFSLPYVDHIDEPNYYLAGLEWRGLFDNNGYYDNVPPGYIALHAALQPLLETAGMSGLAPTIQAFRLVSVLFSLGTLVLVAQTARQVAGPVAGGVAGLAWALSPLILTNTVYALPNPLLYFLAALALWLAISAYQEPARAHWAVWSVVAGLVAVVIRYEAFPLLAPGVLVILIYGYHERRRGLRLGLLALLLIAGTAIALVWGYGFDPGTLDREAAVIRDNWLLNVFDPQRTLNNLYHMFLPLTGPGMLLLGGGLLLGWGRQRAAWVTIGLGAVVIGATVLVTNMYSYVEPDKIRYVLPGTVMACVMLGIAAQWLADRRPGWRALVLAPLLAVVFIPQLQQDIRLVQDRRLPDSRVEMRRWFDTNLEPGTVLVGDENHKTFNPYWGGIPYQHWFDWWEMDDLQARSTAAWVAEHGISYALVPLDQVVAMRDTPEGRAYLDSLLHLRDFAPPPAQRGPRSAAFRLWRMQTETDYGFGDSLNLLGYDLDSAGDAYTLTFYWQADEPPTENYSLFVHLVAADNPAPLAQADGAPARRPTVTWTDPGETLISPAFTVPLPPALSPGTYQIKIGLYNFETGQRLAITDATGAALGDALDLATITVTDQATTG